MEEYFSKHDIKGEKKIDSFSGPKTIVNDTIGHGIENKNHISQF